MTKIGKPMKQIQKILLVLVISIYSSNLLADTLSAQVDRQKIEMGDIITLILKTDFQSLSRPNFSVLQDQFEILGQQQSNQITMINGNFESFTRWDIRLTPKQLGELIIPPITIDNVSSKPVKISVQKLSQNQGKYGVSFLEASVDIKEAFVQQQIIYTLRYYHLGDLVRGNTRPPLFKDLIATSLTKQLNYQKRINGKNYEVYEWRWAIFPQKSGKLIIPPQIFNGQIVHNRTRKRINQHSKAIELTIKAIPKNYPKQSNWLPASSIQLTEEWLQNKVVRVGDSITQTIQIQAEGLLASQLPEIKLEPQQKLHTYPDKAKLESENTTAGVISQSTREIAIIPTNEGNIKLPSYKIHWWNTNTDQLETAIIKARDLTILASLTTNNTANTTVSITPELNKQQHSDGVKSKAIANKERQIKIWQLISLIILVAWIVTLLLWLRQEKQQKINNKARLQAEKAKANHDNTAPNFCNEDKPKEFYQQLNNWLKQQNDQQKVKEQIQKELTELTSHLFNNQKLSEQCLANICIKAKQVIATEAKAQNSTNADKLEKLYL